MSGRTRALKDVLWALTLAGLVAAGLRMWFGLGATTTLTDAVPWGLWKILNMVAGVAISTSGFTMGFLVYVLGLERFRPLMKPAILVAFLGYGCSCLALLFDIGLPWRFWHPFLMWNEHSFLFEVFWCVTLYFTVTAIELAPTVFEQLKAEKATRFLHRIAFGVVIVGISLSSLHHSSLGSLFLVTPQRLEPLWYAPQLPLLFILSAMGGGLMFLVLVRLLHARWYDPEAVFGPEPRPRVLTVLRSGEAGGHAGARAGRDLPLLTGVASIATGVLGVYLLLQLYHLAHGAAWRALVAGTWESWLYGAELIISTVVPILLVWLPRPRRSPACLAVAAFSASAGLLLNRMDVGIFGYFRSAGTVYVPSLAEWALSLGVVAAAALVFLFFVEHTSVFSAPPPQPGIDRRPAASFDAFSRVWRRALAGGVERVTLIAVLVVPLAWALMYPRGAPAGTVLVHAPARLDLTGARLRVDPRDGGLLTVFPHAACEKRLGGDSSCTACHHMSLPGDKATPCFQCHRDQFTPTEIFDHAAHIREVADSEHLEGPYPGNGSCVYCHAAGAAPTAASAKVCIDCHKKDTDWMRTYRDTMHLAWAPGYLEALHGSCLECHEKEAARLHRPELRECSTCHPTLEPRRPAARLARGD